jgi:hypothetical protein
MKLRVENSARATLLEVCHSKGWGSRQERAWHGVQRTVEMLCARWGVVEVELRASNRQDKAANENLKRHKILTTVGLSLLLILVRSLASSLSRQFNLFKLLWLVWVKPEQS